MIHTAYGVPVKIVAKDGVTGYVNLIADVIPPSGCSVWEGARHYSELRADNGIHEIDEAMKAAPEAVIGRP